MGLTNDEKRAAIAARRGPLEHELYAAELDVKVAQKAGDETLLAGPAERLEQVEAQIKVLDDEEAALG